MQYLLLIYGNPAEAPAEAQSQEADAALVHLHAGARGVRRAEGRRRAARSPETATTVRVRDGETLLTDGPFAETKEILGGYYLIDVARPRRRARLGGEDAEHRVRVGRGATGRRLRLTPSGALERAAREDGPGVLATLVRHLGGDLALAEDALQDAYAVALATWPRDGVPGRPRRLAHDHGQAAGDRPPPPHARARRAACARSRRSPSATAPPRAGPRPDDGRRHLPHRRPPAAAVRLLPPVARAARARRADGEVARRPEHGADRARVPRPRADDGGAAAARAAQDRRRRGSRSASRPTSCSTSACAACSRSSTSSSPRATPRRTATR